MKLEKGFLMILIIDVLALVLLTAISLRFLSTKIRKTKEIRPEVMAQYTLTLEVDKFLKLIEKIESQ
jgi:hypothetical protein